MEEIRTHRVSPTHVPPQVTKGVVLAEDMPLAIVIDESIRIVRPVRLWREVECRAVGLVIGRLLSDKERSA